MFLDTTRGTCHQKQSQQRNVPLPTTCANKSQEPQTRRGTRCVGHFLHIRATQRHSGGAAQLNFFTKKALGKPTQRSSTTKATRNLKAPSKKEGLYLEASVKIFAHPMEKTPDPEVESYNHLRPYHDAVNVAGRKFKFFQTLNGCVITSARFTPECVKRVIHARDIAETYTNTRVAVVYSLQARSWKRN